MVRIYHQTDANKETWILEGKKREKLWSSLGWNWLPGYKRPGAWITKSSEIVSSTLRHLEVFHVESEIIDN